jgi:hypothetical protein
MHDAELGDKEIAKNLPPITFATMVQTTRVAIIAGRFLRKAPIIGDEEIPYEERLGEYRALIRKSEALKKALRETPLRDHLRRSFRTIGSQYIMNTLFSFAVFYMNDAMKFQVMADEENARLAWEKVSKRFPEFANEALKRAGNHDLSQAVDADESDWR